LAAVSFSKVTIADLVFSPSDDTDRLLIFPLWGRQQRIGEEARSFDQKLKKSRTSFSVVSPAMLVTWTVVAMAFRGNVEDSGSLRGGGERRSDGGALLKRGTGAWLRHK
jgi:hypothetical protein